MDDYLYLSDFDAGFFIGLVVGESHLGGDGRQAQVTIKMHVDHREVFRWLEEHISGGKLYGPYDHGGRRYYQWMCRGPYLRDVLVPFLNHHLLPQHSERVYQKFLAMKQRYKLDD